MQTKSIQTKQSKKKARESISKENYKKRKQEKNAVLESEAQFRKWQLRDLVLSGITISLVLGGSIVFPNFPIVLGTIIKLINRESEVGPVPRRKVKRVLQQLEKKEILWIEEKGGEVLVHLSKKHKEIIMKYSLRTLLNYKKKQKTWRGKWFMVIFDVPEEQRNKRDYLRDYLQWLGFYQYQKSVYIFPYECEKEIALIKQIVEGGKYIKYVIAEHIEGEKSARVFFKV